jgi:hypothetical protein
MVSGFSGQNPWFFYGENQWIFAYWICHPTAGSWGISMMIPEHSL